MPHYRLFLRGPNGHFARAIEVDAANDAEAIKTAHDLDHPYSAEIWQGTRHVATVETGTG